MNTGQVIAQLAHLKSEGIIEIKAEFEAEATRMNELIRLKHLCSSANLPIILKIGGVEAITDMYQALDIGVDCIIAPMAETPYAVQKFINTVKLLKTRGLAEETKFAINLETITCYENLDSILNLDDIQLLDAITIGRVDFVGSLNKDRSYVDSDDMYQYVEDSFTKIKKAGLGTALGGAISNNSTDFIQKLINKRLVDKYETRKIVFSTDCLSKGKTLIDKAIEFELAWLKYKNQYHTIAANEDLERIKMIENRLKST